LIQAASQLIATQDEVMNGLMKSLGQMKWLCSISKLATKHVLLTIVVSSMGNSSMQCKV
jgi:hypothetical protein